VAERDAAEVQREIEEARASLASTVDQLAERTSPKRIANDAKKNLVAQARTPQGIAILAATAALTALLIVRRVRHRKRD
jgi:hypothetical protein